jgi:diguanylate cyclase (GGDEF)-like protein
MTLDPTSSASALQRVASSLLTSTLSQRGDLLALKDAATGAYIHVNDAMAAWIGKPVDDILGKSDAQLFDADLGRLLRAADVAAIAHGSPLTSEHKFEWRGQRSEFGATRMLVGEPGSSSRDLCVIWHDLTSQRQKDAQLRAALDQIERQQRSLEQLQVQARDDNLHDLSTGMHSAAHFGEQLRREVDLSTREQRQFALVSICLDPLGNEVLSLGPAARSRVIEQLARVLRGNTRAMDASGRLSEEHFAILLSGVGLATAHTRMEGLRRQCATHIVAHEGRDLGFTVSMGVASFPHTADDADSLTSASAAALEEASRRGGNQVVLASIKFASANPSTEAPQG